MPGSRPKTGDRLGQRIDDATRLHDKFPIVLSENSVRSAWVCEEVESCLESERRGNRTVLFPIRLDDAVMNTGEGFEASEEIALACRWTQANADPVFSMPTIQTPDSPPLNDITAQSRPTQKAVCSKYVQARARRRRRFQFQGPIASSKNSRLSPAVV